ncbi:response regulator [Enterobacteriaceae bacterium RIT692]|nr:response regulator [Enterobacteriaceae bacterium RIT692]
MSNIKRKIRLALLDDHPIFRQSFKILCDEAKDLKLVGSYGESAELFTQLQFVKCDVLILDYLLLAEDQDGLSLIKSLLSRYPDINILLSTSVESMAVIRAAYMLGIKGYISKRESGAVYSSAIRTVAHGQRFIPPAIAEQLVQFTGKNNDYLPKPHSHDVDASSVLDKLLTPSETTVISYFLSGMSISDIAKELERSRKTVAGHKNNALRKMGMKSDLELFKFHNDFFKQKIA